MSIPDIIGAPYDYSSFYQPSFRTPSYQQAFQQTQFISRPVQEQLPYGVAHLPVEARRLVLCAWNDRSALAVLVALWQAAMYQKQYFDRRPKDPAAITRMNRVFNELRQRQYSLPATPGERSSDWDDFPF